MFTLTIAINTAGFTTQSLTLRHGGKQAKTIENSQPQKPKILIWCVLLIFREAQSYAMMRSINMLPETEAEAWNAKK